MSFDVSMWELWSEVAKESETLRDPLLLECLEAAESSKMFANMADDKLKTSLSIINSLLNDPKTRPKGLTLLYELVVQVNPSRLVGFQDSLTSSLHLVVKGLESQLASAILVDFLPKCYLMTELNQSVTTSIIPKVLAYFCEDDENSNSQKSMNEIMLLKVCLQHYHGPCGQFREKLEKKLLELISTENGELIDILREVMPLLSFAGGGGNAGEKHTKDWNVMLTKFLKTAYSSLYQLYADHSPTLETENPFDGDQLAGLKRITESRVLLRMTLVKRRLQSLLAVISGYLRMSFPAPKLIPQKGILKLISCLTSVNPVSANKPDATSRRKETVFLMAITPGIHVIALDLLESLLMCVGTNIFSDAAVVEQIITSEFKWLEEKPKAFEHVRSKLYATLESWLGITSGIVTNPKNLSIWIDAVGKDTRVEKDIVELKMSSKPKKGKPLQQNSAPSVFTLGATTEQTFVRKCPQVCLAALRVLIRTIPSLDAVNYRKIYAHLVKTLTIVLELQTPPSPYDEPRCRALIYQNLSCLAHNPQPRSPVTLVVLITLIRAGLRDPTTLVSTSCLNHLHQLERLVHPISAPLSLAEANAIPVALNDNSLFGIDSRMSNESEMNIQSVNPDSEEDEIVEMPGADDVNLTANKDHCRTMNDGSLGETDLEKLDNLQVLIKEATQKTLSDIFRNALMRDGNHGRTVVDFCNDETNSSSSSKVLNQIKPSDVPNNLINDELDEEVIDVEVENGTHNLTNGRTPEVEILADKEKCQDAASQNNESPVNAKRKYGGEVEVVELETEDLNHKKAKTASSVNLKQVPYQDGPTVEEMLSSFVDTEVVE